MSRMTVTDPRFDADDPVSEVPPRRRSKWAPCLIGCLICLVIIGLVAVVSAFWIYQNWRGLAAMGAAEILHQGIDATELPPQERAELKAEVRRVSEDFRAGRISGEQLMAIVEGVTRSPLFSLFLATAVERQYLDASGLTDEEKAEGRRALQRFVRGAADQKIGQQGIDAVLSHIANKQPDGSWELQARVSDAELRAALAEAKAQADKAGIAEEPQEFDPSDELRRVIDEATGQVPAEPPMPKQVDVPEEAAVEHQEEVPEQPAIRQEPETE